MKHAKKKNAMISAAVLAIVATAAVACTGPSTTTPAAAAAATSSSPPSKGATVSPTGSSQIASLLQAGIKQTDQENWSSAGATFQKVLTIDPSNLYANYDLGVIAQATGSSSEAISYYNKALAANAAYTPAMYNEAILLESSHPQQAIALYQKIVSIDPKASTAYLRMALVQAEQGDATGAKANYAKAVALDPAFSKYKLPAKN
jgi:tetratricopeptide (TPR) repeat protein